MEKSDENLGNIKRVNGLGYQSTLLQLENIKEKSSPVQQVWWDTFPIDVSHYENKKCGDQEKRTFAPYPNGSKSEIWF